MFFKKVEIKEYERGFVYKNEKFIEYLKPGKYFKSIFRKVVIMKLTDTQIISSELEILVQNKDFKDEIELIELSDNERALVWKDGVLISVLGAGKYAFWKAFHKIEVEYFEIKGDDDIEIAHKRCNILKYKAQSFDNVLSIHYVNEGYEGFLCYDNRFKKILTAGVYLFWKGFAQISLPQISKKDTIIDVGGQEILTKDKISLRLNVTGVYKVFDTKLAFENVTHCHQALYKEFQFAIRDFIGEKTLDEIISSKSEIGKYINDKVNVESRKFGIEVLSSGIKDIILPGEIKQILHQVIEAEKSAQANMIKRREETASTRSMLNTVKLMENNPLLLRLKEMDLLETLSGKIGNLTVFGGIENLIDKLIKIQKESK